MKTTSEFKHREQRCLFCIFKQEIKPRNNFTTLVCFSGVTMTMVQVQIEPLLCLVIKWFLCEQENIQHQVQTFLTWRCKTWQRLSHLHLTCHLYLWDTLSAAVNVANCIVISQTTRVDVVSKCKWHLYSMITLCEQTEIKLFPSAEMWSLKRMIIIFIYKKCKCKAQTYLSETDHVNKEEMQPSGGNTWDRKHRCLFWFLPSHSQCPTSSAAEPTLSLQWTPTTEQTDRERQRDR